MSLNLHFAVTFVDLFITIQYAIVCKSLSTFHESLYIYIYMCVYICIYIHVCVYICIYIYIYKTLNETAKGNFKNTLIQ